MCVYVTLRVKPLTENYHLAIFDYHWSEASGDKTYVCQVILIDCETGRETEWMGLIGWVLLIACHYPAIFGGDKHRGSEWISQISIKITKIKTEIV